MTKKTSKSNLHSLQSNAHNKSYKYSSFYSSRNPRTPKKLKRGISAPKAFVGIVIVIVAVLVAVPKIISAHENSTNKAHKTSFVYEKNLKQVSSLNNPKISKLNNLVTPTVTTSASAGCVGNTQTSLLIASISQRHLWACDGSQTLYQTAVVTGNMNVIEDATPIGTFHIYGKETNLYLKGCDSTGCWNDYVNYWMPFLDNEYGIFGLHDATWRAPGDFGNISPYASNASHGCIELPLAAAQWIYNWSSVGTTVEIIS